jgi:hypothetical protein
MARRARTTERLISRLSREIAEIDEFFYGDSEGMDRDAFAAMMERRRDDIVRVAVIQLHTAIEDVLTDWISCRMLGQRREGRKRRGRTVAGLALRRLLFGRGGIGFERKLHLAVALGLITPSTQRRLEELNTLRNKCSHNWLLNVLVRRGRKPKDKKLPLLRHRGHDLHKVDVLRSMLSEYGPLYSRLFVNSLDG